MSAGVVNAAPETVRLAREIRCAIVASGTRNASAISLVVRPPDRPQGERDRRGRAQVRVAAQEHQQERVVGLLRRAGLGLLGDDLLAPSPSGLGPLQVDELALGDGDQPGARWSGSCSAQARWASISASWTASSADAKSAPRRTRTPSTCGLSSRSSASVTRWPGRRPSPAAPRATRGSARRPCPAPTTPRRPPRGRGPRTRRRS